MPSDEEDAAINAGIAADPDTYVVSDDVFAKAVAAKRRGRPAGSGSKEKVTLRLDHDVVEALRRTGAGWQTRLNDRLRDLVLGKH